MSVIVDGKCLTEQDCFLIAAALKQSAKGWRKAGQNSKDFKSFFNGKADQLENLSSHFYKEGISTYDFKPSEQTELKET